MDDLPSPESSQATRVPVRCVHCSYDVSSVPPTGVCPECGWAMAETLEGHRSVLRGGLKRMRRRIRDLGWVLCFAAALTLFTGSLEVASFVLYERLGPSWTGWTSIGVAMGLPSFLFGIAMIAWWVDALFIGSGHACRPWPALRPFGRRLVIASLAQVGVSILLVVGVSLVLWFEPALAEITTLVGGVIILVTVWWMADATARLVERLGAEPSVGVAVSSAARRWNLVTGILRLGLVCLNLFVPLTVSFAVGSDESAPRILGANNIEVASAWWLCSLAALASLAWVAYAVSIWRACWAISQRIPVTTESLPGLARINAQGAFEVAV